MTREEILAEACRFIAMSKPEIVQCWRLIPTAHFMENRATDAEWRVGGRKPGTGKQRRREYKMNWSRTENFTLCFWEPIEFSNGPVKSACAKHVFADSVGGVTLRGIIRKKDLGPLPLCVDCAERFADFLAKDAARILNHEVAHTFSEHELREIDKWMK